MSIQRFTNNATTTLQSAITAAYVTLTVQTNTGSKFPALGANEFFYVTLYNLTGAEETDHEVLKVTARSADTFTVLRGQEGTTPRDWAAGTNLELRLTASTLDNFVQTSYSVPQLNTELLSVHKDTSNTNYPDVKLGYAADGTAATFKVDRIGGTDTYRPLDVYTGNIRRLRVYTSTANVFAFGGYTLLPTWGSTEAGGVNTTVLTVGRTLSLVEHGSTANFLVQNAYRAQDGFWYSSGLSSAVTFGSGAVSVLTAVYSGSPSTPVSWTTAASWNASGNMTAAGDISLSIGKKLKVNGNSVVGDRDTGWTAATGNALKGAFDTSTATTTNCAERIKALEDALRSHGLIN